MSTPRPLAKLFGTVAISLSFAVVFAIPVTGQSISGVTDASNIGLPENGVFNGSDFDMVQTNNGYIHIRIPLIDMKGRGLSYPFEFIYDSSSFYETVKTVSNGHGGYNIYYTWQVSTGDSGTGNQPWKLATPTNYAVIKNTRSYCTTLRNTIMKQAI